MTLFLETTNILSAIIYLAITTAVVVETRRLGVGVPLVIAALVGYFVVRVVDLLAAPDPLLGYSPLLDAATDVAVIALLLFLLMHVRRLVRGALATVGEARLRLAEYERARHDYSVAVHSQVAGPISVISGAAQALQASPDDERSREQLIELIAASADVLRTVSAELEELRRTPEPD